MGTAGVLVTVAAAGALLGAAMHWPARRLARHPHAVILRPSVFAVSTAALFAAAVWRVPDLVTVALVAAVVIAGVPLAALDLAERRLPTPLIGLLYAAVLAVVIVDGVWRGDPAPALRAGVGVLVALGFYLAVALVSGSLGAGDVRLAGALGLALTWQSWTSLVLGNLLGLALAAIAGLAVLVLRGGTRHTRIPLGPALIAGALVALLVPS